MELTQLKFVVDTSELKNAATEIERLGVAVSKLNKPMQEATKASSNLNKEQSASTTVVKENESAVKKQVSVLERQQMILEFMTQGFSKGQSSQLAYAKAAGAVTAEIEQLGKVLQTQRTLMGTDPFDKSLGAMQALKNEYTVIKEVQRLYNAELGLSKSQMEDLAREKLRLIEKFKLEGASLSDVKNGLRELETAYVKNATAENSITQSIRSRQKAIQDTAKAQDYVAKEFDRVNRLTADNGNITSATNNKLIQMEKALRLSGLSAAEQAAKLNTYRKSLESIQKAAGNRQVDYLSRALGPQITDVFVGLATGQSPLMVLLQQGGQLRDQFALAGVAGADMGKMLVEASKAMVTSVKDVAVAVGGLLLNAVTSTASAIGSGLLAPFKLMGAYLYDMATGANTAAGAIEALKVAFTALGKVGILVVITAAISAIVALKDLIKEQQEVSKAANLMGGSLGLTTDKIYSQAQAFAGADGSVTKYIAAINSAAKAGVTSSSDLKLVTDAMVALQKVGVDADETAKRFADLGKEPTKALREFAKESGLIRPAILEQVRLLEEQGKKSEAVALATKEMSKAMVSASEKIQQEQGYILRAFNAITSGAKSMWEAILNIGRPTSLTDQLFEAESKLTTALKGDMRSKGRQEAVINLQKQIATLREQIDAEKELQKQKEESSKAAAGGEEADKARKKAQDELNKALEYTNGLLSKSDGFTADYAEKVKMLNLAFTTKEFKGPDAQAKMNEAWAELLKQQPIVKKAIDDVKKSEDERKKTLEAINNIEARADLMGKEYYTNLLAIKKAVDLNIISEERAAELRKKAYEATPGMRAFAKAQADSAKVLTDVETQRRNILSQYASDFKPEIVKSQLEAENKLRKEFADADAILAKQKAEVELTIAAEKRNEAIEGYEQENEARKRLAQDGYDRQIYLLSDSYRRQQTYATAFENLFSNMGDAIAEFALTGKKSFGDLVKSMITDLIRFEMRMQMSNVFKGLGGFGGIIGALTNGGFNFSTASTYGTNVGSQQTAMLAAQEFGMFAKGGTFTNSIVDSPTLFKFAKGTGLMGEAGPEAIMPLKRGPDGTLGVQAGGTSSNVQVVVNNNSNAHATATESVDSRGNRRIEVTIGDMVAAEVNRKGSSVNSAITSNLGTRNQIIRR